MNILVSLCCLRQTGMSKFGGEKSRTAFTTKQTFKPTFVGQTVP